MTQTANNSSSTQQGMLLLNTPLVDTTTGYVSLSWYKWFVQIWQLCGGGTVELSSGGYLKFGDDEALEVYSTENNELIGRIPTTGTPGSDATAIALSSSPTTFTATESGWASVSSGQVEFSRDSGSTWYTVGLTGANIPMRVNDKLRVTWYDTVPTAVFFPD